LKEFDLTDEQLVTIIQSPATRGKKLRSGTTIARNDAWYELVKRYTPRLEKKAVSFWKGDHDAAEETVQWLWVKVLGKIDQVKVNFEAWIDKSLHSQFVDDFRRKRSAERRLPTSSLDATDTDRVPFKQDSGGPNTVERQLDKKKSDPSAEQVYMERWMSNRFNRLVEKHLSNSKVSFFLGYREDPNLKKPKEKTRFLRVKAEFISSMIKEWDSSGRSLDTIMNPRQAYALTARFSLKRRYSDIFHDMGITKRKELDDLLACAISRLIQALLDETPDD